MLIFDKLANEHARIQKVIDALDIFVGDVQKKSTLDLHELIRFVTFLRGYADGFHHEREEKVLFPCLVQAGFSLKMGPLAHIHEQHQEEARLLLRFEMAASAPAPWQSSELDTIANAARALTSFERAHMTKEREIFFPAAKKEILAGQTDELDRLLKRFEEKRAPRWDFPWLEQLGDALGAAHIPPPK